jgi:hypothetical protein
VAASYLSLSWTTNWPAFPLHGVIAAFSCIGLTGTGKDNQDVSWQRNTIQ